jgi:hypothetical protein
MQQVWGARAHLMSENCSAAMPAKAPAQAHTKVSVHIRGVAEHTTQII